MKIVRKFRAGLMLTWCSGNKIQAIFPLGMRQRNFCYLVGMCNGIFSAP